MLRHVPQHFDEAHYRELLDVFDKLDAGGAHLIAANAREPIRHTARGKLARDAGGVKVAGHFSGDEKNVTHDWMPARYRRGLETCARCRGRS